MQAGTKKIIEVKNWSFAHNKGNYALKNISFTIKKGARIMIIGPNGSGKTTLLKTMTGFVKTIQRKFFSFGEKTRKS